jgi:hypothetical protein
MIKATTTMTVATTAWGLEGAGLAGEALAVVVAVPEVALRLLPMVGREPEVAAPRLEGPPVGPAQIRTKTAVSPSPFLISLRHG